MTRKKVYACSVHILFSFQIFLTCSFLQTDRESSCLLNAVLNVLMLQLIATFVHIDVQIILILAVVVFSH